jgi:hypothetical protein
MQMCILSTTASTPDFHKILIECRATGGHPNREIFLFPTKYQYHRRPSKQENTTHCHEVMYDNTPEKKNYSEFSVEFKRKKNNLASSLQRLLMDHLKLSENRQYTRTKHRSQVSTNRAARNAELVRTKLLPKEDALSQHLPNDLHPTP